MRFTATGFPPCCESQAVATSPKLPRPRILLPLKSYRLGTVKVWPPTVEAERLMAEFEGTPRHGLGGPKNQLEFRSE